MSDHAALLSALRFASVKHRDQRRKGAEASPYINHPIEVAELIARVGGITDVVALQGAILHDTIEDTETTGEELERLFGPEVRGVVEEVTDDKALEKHERKQLQIEHAPHLSKRAQLVKLADKISNVRAVTDAPPADWPEARRREYLDWTEKVVSGLKGCNDPLMALYDESLHGGREALRERDGATGPTATIRLDEATAVLERTPSTLAALLGGLPDVWIRATEGEGTWSPYDVVVHLAHGERTNWIPRARHILSGATRPFEPFARVDEAAQGETVGIDERLATFAALRRENLAALAEMHLGPDDLAREGLHPQFGPVTLGQLLATWVAHDMDHLGQIARTMAKAYSSSVGPWSAFLSILRDRTK